MSTTDSPQLRLARPDDGIALASLYHAIYQGRYSDPLMSDADRIARFIAIPANVWVVADSGGALVGSVVYEGDPAQRLAKVFGGVVLPAHRGASLLERMMTFGAAELDRRMDGTEVVFAMTRTASPAPQLITERMGYRELGVLPNIHKTQAYETHCLSAWFRPRALEKRRTGFRLHPAIGGLYRLVARECGLPPLPTASPSDYTATGTPRASGIDLELIQAARFVHYQFGRQKKHSHFVAGFYPLLSPNALLTSPSQSVELFLFLEESDKTCAILGVRKPNDFSLQDILDRAIQILGDRGLRYVEIIVPAEDAKAVEQIVRARFIPCAYFPALRLVGNERLDYVVLSRTFEMLDFSHLEMTARSLDFLNEYSRAWRESYLSPRYPTTTESVIEPGIEMSSEVDYVH